MKNAGLELRFGNLVRGSVRGAKGFYYPSDDVIPISENCVAVPMAGWQPYSSYVAYKIPTSAVRSKYRYSSESNFMVVWCERAQGEE